MKRKNTTIKYKTMLFKAEMADNGKITGYFSTYDKIPDSYGDIVAKGAFTDTIRARTDSGHPFPLCWNHDLNQIIGAVEGIKDDEHGPLMTAHFFDSPLAQEKRELVKTGVVYQFSFAYDTLEDGIVTLEDGTKAHELRKIDLFEVSIVPIPANPRATVTDIKSGRRNSKADEVTIGQVSDLLKSASDTIEAAAEKLHSLIDSETDVPDDGEDNPEDNGKPEDQKASNPKKEELLNYIKNLKMEEK
jgi:HK97 family phage prohead protease